MKAISLWIGIKQRAGGQKLALAFAFAVLVATLTALPVIAQQPSEDSSADGPKSDAISGRVVNENGQPIANATVILRALDSQGQGSITTSDSEGSFRVSGLEAMAYRVWASVPAHTAAPRDPTNDQPRYYRVGDSVQLEMIKGGVVTGVVTTSAGEPVVAVRVHAYMIRDSNGQPPRYGAQSRQLITDDRGVYRIYGLPAGTYVVAAGGAGNSWGFNLPNAYATDTPTYAPSSGRNTAREISVRAGEETTNVDIRYRGEPGFMISGSASHPMSAAEPSGFSITLSSIHTGVPQENLSTHQSPISQGFALYGVANGDYLLTAQSYFGGEWAVSESRRIRVRGADLTGLELIIKPLGSIAGRVALEGSKADECEGERRPLFGETVITPWHNDKESKDQPLFLWSVGGPATPKKDGAFILRNLAPGQYRLNARFFARYWYPRSITLPPSMTSQRKTPSAHRLFDAAQNWITVKPGDRVSDLVITLAEGAASIHGQVRTPEGQKRAPRLSVFLVPAEGQNAEDVLRFFVSLVLTDGSFALNNLPPGRYWIIARPAEENESDLQSQLRLPDQAEARAKLRQEVEAVKSEIELKPCQNVTNYSLPFTVP
ncbi:MAG: carboxypeptidase regulatory-like domain-containing protein [Pyrinomonadaceae bacterium]|nr:carboxypeptidase regulatory-like domain-containing protein [Pyrinomonadaceae bacterium]